MNHLTEIMKKDYENTTGVFINHKGKNVYEEYFHQCDENTSMHVFSVTKSIMSLLIGLAIEQGKIAGTEEKILSFFPSYEPRAREKVLQEVRLKDLLTMTVPYRYKYNPYTKYFTAEDQVKFSLDQMGGKYGEIGTFRYAPLIGPDVLSGIIRNVTGMSVKEYAKKYLFTPLGISDKEDICFESKEQQMEFYKRMDLNGWVHDRSGNYNAGWGLHLTIKEMAAIGELMLNHGFREGKEIIPQKWIIDSTTPKVFPSQIPFSYGYLWWIIDEKQRAYAALGDGGNTIYVNESKELVVAMNCIFKPRSKDRIALIKQMIEKECKI